MLAESLTKLSNASPASMMAACGGHKTGYLDLDNMLGGFQKSDLIVLAARPSVGKTAFAVNLAYNVAKQKIPVGVFSMEMSIDQVVDRFIALASGSVSGKCGRANFPKSRTSFFESRWPVTN